MIGDIIVEYIECNFVNTITLLFNRDVTIGFGMALHNEDFETMQNAVRLCVA
jgi:hypothetical protein